MFCMPGLTGDVLLSQAKEMGLAIYGQMVNLSKEQWVELQKGCETALGISGWQDELYRECMNAWKRKGWGTTFGPGSTGVYKKKGKKEMGGDVEVKISNKNQSAQVVLL